MFGWCAGNMELSVTAQRCHCPKNTRAAPMGKGTAHPKVENTTQSGGKKKVKRAVRASEEVKPWSIHSSQGRAPAGAGNEHRRKELLQSPGFCLFMFKFTFLHTICGFPPYLSVFSVPVILKWEALGSRSLGKCPS